MIIIMILLFEEKTAFCSKINHVKHSQEKTHSLQRKKKHLLNEKCQN